jgi:hypothetical protein
LLSDYARTPERLSGFPGQADNLHRLIQTFELYDLRLTDELPAGSNFTRGDDLATISKRSDASRFVDTFAAVVAATERGDIAMHTDPQLWCESVRTPVLGQFALDFDRAFEGITRIREDNQEAVAGVIYLFPMVLAEKRAQRLIVPAEHIGPGLIANHRDEVSRLNDVGEHEGAPYRLGGASLFFERALQPGQDADRSPCVEDRAKAPKGRIRRAKLHRRCVNIAARALHFGALHLSPRRFIR